LEEKQMKKIDKFTQRNWSKYPFAEMLADGGIYQLEAGKEDFFPLGENATETGRKAEGIRRAAHLYAKRQGQKTGRPLKAKTSVSRAKDKIEIQFVEGQ